MSGKRYTDEFKIEAVKQVTERGHSVAEVAERLGITTHSLYAWKVKFGQPDTVRRAELDQSAEVRRLKAELKRVTEERDILKNRGVLRQGVKAKYVFMQAHAREFRLCAMCRVLGVHRSGYYGWLSQQASAREHEDARLLGRIKHFWLASGGVYGHRKITCDLREAGERCSRHRVRRLMKREGLRAQIGYGSKPRHRGGPVGGVANVRDREFAPTKAGCTWRP